MATLLLDYEIDFDFVVIGISSNQRAYTLSWEINNMLDAELELIAPLEIKSKKIVRYYKNYESFQERFRFNLLANKAESARLIPEYPTIDYFLKYHEEESPYTCTELISALRKSKLIQAVFNLDLEKIKSKQAFIF